MKQQTFLLYSLAAALTVFTGFVYMNSEEVRVAALIIMVSAGTLALIEPRAAWRWALILGLSIPIINLIVPLMDDTTLFNLNSYWNSFIAFIPASIGAYGGVFTRWLFSRRSAKS
jgi:hypothetical protein